MKKILSMMMTLLLILPVMTGCSSEGSKSVTTDGSTSMQKVIGALGEAFQNDRGYHFFGSANPLGSCKRMIYRHFMSSFVS